MRRLVGWIVIVVILAVPAAAGWAAPSAPDAGVTEIISLSSNETQGIGHSQLARMTPDGRFIVFMSAAGTLVPNDNNGREDIFVRDRLNGTTERVSVASDETEANHTSFFSSISADGRYVTFDSMASNLFPDDTNNVSDIFVRDLLTGTTERISVDSFETQGNGSSTDPLISADGLFVAFRSNASNLVGGDTNGDGDIFVRNLVNGTTERISVSADEQQATDQSSSPSISANGRFVAFQSFATNLVPGDTNAKVDIFVRDRISGSTERVSLASSGTQADGDSSLAAIAPDGSFVAFRSVATNLVPGDTNGEQDIFVRERTGGTTERVSLADDETQANSDSGSLAISADGRYVAFETDASNLIPGDIPFSTDIFVRDRTAGTTERVSVSTSGEAANNFCVSPAISADGSLVTFTSFASNLVPGDANASYDVFLRERLEDGLMLYLPLALNR